MSKSNEKKSHQLGEPYGTACNKIRKQLMFRLMQKCDMDMCFQCGEKIDHIDKMSIEHKAPWLDSEDPSGMFYDPENICFSHMHCNIGEARKKPTPPVRHGTTGAYNNHNCRCAPCKLAKAKVKARYTKKRRLS